MSSYRDNKAVCTFFSKIGACRHGEKCSRKHIKPAQSDTILLANLYQNPKINNNGSTMDSKQLQEYFDRFYKDVFLHFMKFGEIRSMVVCENDNHHLNGNVYVRFGDKELAYSAVQLLNQEWYAGRPVYCELSPVESFHDANCRAYDNNACNRGDHCNFMHIHRPSLSLKSSLFNVQEKYHLQKKVQALQSSSTSSSEKKPSATSHAAIPANPILLNTLTASAEAVERLFTPTA